MLVESYTYTGIAFGTPLAIARRVPYPYAIMSHSTLDANVDSKGVN